MTKTKRPRVRATESDFARLAGLVRAGGSELLLEELERFTIVPDHADRRLRFVRLGSQVTYRDLTLGRERTVRVGLPGEADMDENRISVLAPVGAALIGLSTGDVFRWAGPDARARAIEVLRIED